MATRAVFPDPDHGSFKADVTLTAPVPNDKLPRIVFRLEECYKRSRMAACRAEHPFDAIGIPSPF